MTAQALPKWLEQVRTILDSTGWTGVYLAAFPEYRPDLVKNMAHHLRLEYFDFRAAVMAVAGTEAAHMDLDALERSMGTHAGKRGVVVMNAEALLATKPEQERKRWLHSVTALEFPHPVIIPLSVFPEDVDPQDPRFFRIDPGALPEQSLIGRLAN